MIPLVLKLYPAYYFYYYRNTQSVGQTEKEAFQDVFVYDLCFI